jgi:hypothetical protein
MISSSAPGVCFVNLCPAVLTAHAQRSVAESPRAGSRLCRLFAGPPSTCVSGSVEQAGGFSVGVACVYQRVGSDRCRCSQCCPACTTSSGR